MIDDAGRLRWRCRRGMRELDAVLAGFLERRFAALSEPEKAEFARFLDLPDPDIYGYLTGRQHAPDPAIAAIVTAIRDSAHDR